MLLCLSSVCLYDSAVQASWLLLLLSILQVPNTHTQTCRYKLFQLLLFIRYSKNKMAAIHNNNICLISKIVTVCCAKHAVNTSSVCYPNDPATGILRSFVQCHIYDTTAVFVFIDARVR